MAEGIIAGDFGIYVGAAAAAAADLLGATGGCSVDAPRRHEAGGGHQAHDVQDSAQG